MKTAKIITKFYFYYTKFVQQPFFQDNLGKPALEKQNHSGKTNLHLLEQEWQWHQLGHMHLTSDR